MSFALLRINARTCVDEVVPFLLLQLDKAARAFLVMSFVRNFKNVLIGTPLFFSRKLESNALITAVNGARALCHVVLK